MRLGPLYLTPSVTLTNFGVDTNVFNAAGERQQDFTFSLSPHVDTWLPFGRRTLLETSVTAGIGKVPPNPAELLSSQRFQVFLSSLDEHFDWVIIDTPPVADATIVAHIVTGVLFVVGAEMTNRRAADVALAQLTQANARFAGAVLNHVNLVRNSYYYSHYYRREYAKYYQRA